jgi:hypothetical protein
VFRGCGREATHNILQIQTHLEVRKDEPVVTVTGRGDGRHLRRGWRIILKKMYRSELHKKLTPILLGNIVKNDIVKIRKTKL